MNEASKRFLSRRDEVRQVAKQISGFLASGQGEGLLSFLDQYRASDVTAALLLLAEAERQAVFGLLDPEDKAAVLEGVGADTAADLVRATDPRVLADLVEAMSADEAADLLQAMDAADAARVLPLMDPDTARDVREILRYPPHTAGGIMSVEFVAVREEMTAAQAIETIRSAAGRAPTSYIYAVDSKERLRGVLNLHRLILAPPETPVREIASSDIVAVPASQDRQETAEVFARYGFLSVPVVDDSRRLLGIVTAQDAIDVISEEHTEDVAAMVGAAPSEFEHLPARRRAILRLPWLIITIGIQLIGGLVIAQFDQTLSRVILLVSFMPVIQAISGNTGLQSATLVVRGLATGHVQIEAWRQAMLQQLKTTLILGVLCGGLVGTIGALWHGTWAFGLVVGVSMFVGINLSAITGTGFPLLSKRLGFDPAITAGPFETAFQDVVGVSFYLGLATLLLAWLG